MMAFTVRNSFSVYFFLFLFRCCSLFLFLFASQIHSSYPCAFSLQAMQLCSTLYIYIKHIMYINCVYIVYKMNVFECMVWCTCLCLCFLQWAMKIKNLEWNKWIADNLKASRNHHLFMRIAKSLNLTIILMQFNIHSFNVNFKW